MALGERSVSTYLENWRLALGESPCLSILLDCNLNNCEYPEETKMPNAAVVYADYPISI